MPPIEQWKHEVLTLVNKVRTKNSLGQLAWGDTCVDGANTRANETKTLYAHTRPDGSSWATACPAPEGAEGAQLLPSGLVMVMIMLILMPAISNITTFIRALISGKSTEKKDK